MIAIVLAAGLSTRMGRPKMLLPWGNTTVIGQVVATLAEAGVGEVVVVTGAAREAVAAAARPPLPLGEGTGVRAVFNPRYEEDSMMVSLQVGLAALYPPPGLPPFSPRSAPEHGMGCGGENGGREGGEAALVALGDQPQIEAAIVRALVDAYRETRAPLVVPSYHMRRGHPWVLDRSLWPEALSAPARATLRDFLNAHSSRIHYLPVESASILQDLDTPDDYQRSQP